MNTGTVDSRRTIWVATAGVMVIPIVVPIFEGRISVGPLPLDAVILSVVIALVASFPYLRQTGAGVLPATGVAIPVAAFLGIAAIGAAVHGTPGTLMTWFRYACYFALVPVVGLIAQNAARRRVLLWATLLGGSLTLLHATYQYLNPASAQAIGMRELAETVGTRVYSTFENPNFFAEYLVLLFAAALSLVLTEKGLPRIVALTVTGYTGVILLLTYTRGSWVALAIGVAITVLLVNWRLLIPLAVAASVAVVMLPGVGSRLLSIVSTEGTASFRMRLWRIAGEIISNHPLLGVGLGDFYRGFQEVVFTYPGLGVGFTIYGAHNSYFQIAAETGVFGGLAFLIAIAVLVKAGVAYSFAHYPIERERLQAAALLAGIIAFAFNGLTSNVFQHPQGAVFFFFIAGISAGIGVHAKQRDSIAEMQARKATVFSTSLVGRCSHYLARMTVSSSAWASLTRLPGQTGLLDTSAVVTWLLGSGPGRGSPKAA